MNVRVCAATVAAAAVLARWPSDPAGIERVYSLAVYPGIQHTMTWLSDTTPVSWLDVAAAAVVVWTLWGLWRVARAPRGTRGKAVVRAGCAVAAVAAVTYVAFLLVWGLNYRRLPVVERVRFDAARVDDAAVAAFAAGAVTQLNGLAATLRSGPAYEEGWAAVAERLRPPFERAATAVGLPPPRTARPKVPVLAWYFDRTGVSGMTNPLGLETLVASNLLPIERPMVVAHEWAHLAGIGPEADASFVGFLACTNADPWSRYSAWFDVTLRVLRLLPDAERARYVRQLDRRVLDDIDAIQRRNARDHVAWLNAAAWRVYDSYLKANRVTEGVRSYDAVVALLVGTEFGPHWTPRLR